MSAGCWPVKAALGVALFSAGLGCTASPQPSSAQVDETAVAKYQAVLAKQIDANDEVASILATVDVDAASRENAKLRLADLSVKIDAIQKELQALRGMDYAVRSEAAARLMERQAVVAKRLSEQIRRINNMPGGEEFFQKDLRQLVESLKR